MNEPSFLSPLEETVVVIGVGLIGGSLAAALRSRRVSRTVIGVGRDIDRLKQAHAAGLIDEVSTDISQAAARADVVVFCTPVDQVVDGVRLAVHGARPGVLLTDAGSVKQPICDALADVSAFVGAHPIAGSHRKGFEAADPELFEGRVCVLTPSPTADAAQVSRLDRFWRAIGMRTVSMSPAEHDRALAMTSHLPHVVAASLSRTLADENRRLTGSGFRDTTRIAAGDPELWCGILLQNAEHVLAGIDAVQHQLNEYRSALGTGDAERLRELLVDAQRRREGLG
ncbi:MAG: prephenate dehydrogenase/arogenate dehydrogenase family protein [Planctomycetes bacterium]|nr:prephenate dehydrogenase/arogenate dehydrogenase family protein [Planctomycetota bacterium]